MLQALTRLGARRLCTAGSPTASTKVTLRVPSPQIPPPPPPTPGEGRVVFVARSAAVALGLFIGYRQLTGQADLLDDAPPAIMPPMPEAPETGPETAGGTGPAETRA